MPPFNYQYDMADSQWRDLRENAVTILRKPRTENLQCTALTPRSLTHHHHQLLRAFSWLYHTPFAEWDQQLVLLNAELPFTLCSVWQCSREWLVAEALAQQLACLPAHHTATPLSLSYLCSYLHGACVAWVLLLLGINFVIGKLAGSRVFRVQCKLHCKTAPLPALPNLTVL